MHGDCRRHDDGFDSDLCTCGCAEIHVFVTAKEIAGFLRDEVEGKPTSGQWRTPAPLMPALDNRTSCAVGFI
jgi:hypothetical protein